MTTIGQSLKKIHELGLQHRDFKIENLLYFSDSIIKLCDFGSISQKVINFDNLESLETDQAIEEFEKSTTLMYRPPEMCDPYLKYQVD